MALSQIAHVRPSTPSAALEVMYRTPPLDLFIQNCAQNAAIRVKPDTTWQPQAKAKARVAHFLRNIIIVYFNKKKRHGQFSIPPPHSINDIYRDR
jgi:hypothetical protein